MPSVLRERGPNQVIWGLFKAFGFQIAWTWRQLAGNPFGTDGVREPSKPALKLDNTGSLAALSSDPPPHSCTRQANLYFVELLCSCSHFYLFFPHFQLAFYFLQIHLLFFIQAHFAYSGDHQAAKFSRVVILESFV